MEAALNATRRDIGVEMADNCRDIFDDEEKARLWESFARAMVKAVKKVPLEEMK
jgi:hypothetical protein